MAKSFLLLAGSVALVTALVLVGFRLHERERASAPCPSEEVEPIAGAARERPAGPGIWSAWITYPPVAGDPVTVLWRVEGDQDGTLVVSGRDREDARLELVFGPTQVIPPLAGAGLPWERGGREWGVRILFGRAGCWHLRVEAGDRRGELDVAVRPKTLSGKRLQK